MSEQVRLIAMRIKDLREISDLSVAEMARALQVDEESYLSYESGETDIPISFLLKINELFHVDMTELLTGEAPRLSTYAVTRAGRGKKIVRTNHYVYKNLAYNFIGRRIEPLYTTVPPHANENLETNSHDGHEFDYILDGEMRLLIGGREVLLSPGDCIYYNSRLPHAMQAAGDAPVNFLAIVIPE